ncbi:MAG: hypothetical protein E7672_09355, partial [Ruminococcaceae bacterium]|nr:hypothetical protein [Oscillospiraceae bacterium]
MFSFYAIFPVIYVVLYIMKYFIPHERLIMFDSNKENRRISISDAVFLILISILFYLKTKLFYDNLNLAEFPLPLAFASVAILCGIYTIFCLFSPRAAKIAVFSTYIAISVFMCVDAVYFAYATKLPSVALLGMLWQVNDVSDTVESLLRIYHVLLIIDIPLWILFGVNKDILIAKIQRSRVSDLFRNFTSKIVSSAKVALVSLALGLAAGAVPLFFPNFEAEYMMNEVFCYHVHDVAYTLRSYANDSTVDKTKYTSPDYSDSEYYGLAKDRNVIVIQVESLQNFVIGAYYDGQELTPNLNRLIAKDSFYFDNYYYQIGGGNTSDAEFTVNNSLFAPERSSAYVKYTENKYYGMPHLLKDNGYTGSYVFHGYIAEFWNREIAYPYQGFDDYISLEDLVQDDMFPIGVSDMSFFRQSVDVIKTYEEPFHTFLITVSSHNPYAIPLKDREIQLKPEDEGTLFGFYLQSINYADRAIGEFLNLL